MNYKTPFFGAVAGTVVAIAGTSIFETPFKSIALIGALIAAHLLASYRGKL